MRIKADDGILHLYLPHNQYWARSLLPGIARFIRDETPLFIVNHSEEGLLPELANATRRPAALLGLISSGDQELLRVLKRRGIRAVNISSRYPPKGIESVLHDDAAIGRMAAEHLAGLGRRRYGFVGMGDDLLTANRLSGFRAGLKAIGETSPISVFNGHSNELQPWVGGLRLPAAVFCASDGRARAVAQRVERLGIQVPDQLAILGVDNDPYDCDLTRIPLSSIELRFEELGYRAAERIWALYRGEPRSGTAIQMRPSHVEVRLSTNYLAVEDSIVREAMRYIRQPQSGPLTVAAVAEGIGVSRRVLEMHFRKATGRTVFEEIHESRMERALRLVEESNLSVETISERIGLADTRRFVKLFKERYGKTPFSYRRGR